MREDKLSVQSMDFAVEIINLIKELKFKKESIISNQIVISRNIFASFFPVYCLLSMPFSI